MRVENPDFPPAPNEGEIPEKALDQVSGGTIPLIDPLAPPDLDDKLTINQIEAATGLNLD